MAEETKDPVKTFPQDPAERAVDRRRGLRHGLHRGGGAGPGRRAQGQRHPRSSRSSRQGAPGLPIDDILPFMTMFAVSNTALINMLMASRLIYGMARQRVLPQVLGTVHPTRRSPPWVAIVFTTLIAFG